MPAPVVQNLQDIIAELGKSVDPQKALIDESIIANTNAGAAQEAGLGAQKDTAFRGIEQGAQNKGMYFSGFSPDEQAKYTAGTYLPALAQLQATIAGTRASLLGKKADLDTDVYQKAFNTRENQNAQLNTYNSEQERRAFEANQAAIARAAAAAEAEKNRQFEARQNAANRAASAAGSASKDISGIVNNISNFLSSKKGKDGKVSPASFQQARQQWIAAGGSADSFNQSFTGYVNRSHEKDYY